MDQPMDTLEVDTLHLLHHDGWHNGSGCDPRCADCLVDALESAKNDLMHWMGDDAGADSTPLLIERALNTLLAARQA